MTEHKRTVLRTMFMTLVAMLCFAVFTFGQQAQAPPQSAAPSQEQQQQENMSQQPASADTSQTPAAELSPESAAGMKMTVKGVIVSRSPDSIVIRDFSGGTTVVKLTEATKFEERKTNPFRGARKYTVDQLANGMPVEAKGRTGDDGTLVASKIRFKNAEYKLGQSMESQIDPLQRHVNSNEKRISAAEMNAQHLSGQIEESNANAKAAQATADTALASAYAAHGRMLNLDNYDVRDKAVVQFQVGSARLSPQGMQQLDQLARAAAAQQGYIIQVVGFASSDGSEASNEALSRRRADAVVSYLVNRKKIPLRRIVFPFGQGENNPVASNDTPAGREKNRRAEATVLVSKGLSAQPAPQGQPSTGAQSSGDNPH